MTEYYGVKRMKIVLDGERVGKRKANGWVACYLENRAYFTKKGLTKLTILHELYHHLISFRKSGIIERREGSKSIRTAIS